MSDGEQSALAALLLRKARADLSAAQAVSTRYDELDEPLDVAAALATAEAAIRWATGNG